MFQNHALPLRCNTLRIPSTFMSELSFAELGLDPAVLEAVSAVGYETPSPIQAQSIPALLAGNHLLGVAQTGTGKTAAFALPLLSRIDANIAEPQILVLAPTRSEEHTSELQSRPHLVCRLLL